MLKSLDFLYCILASFSIFFFFLIMIFCRVARELSIWGLDSFAVRM